MDFWTFVFLVVLIGCSVGVIGIWTDHRVKMRQVHGNANPEANKRLHDLAERVKVL
ncbi:MAG: hypothetical protein V3U43_10865 [Pseudomonadales bacterium]